MYLTICGNYAPRSLMHLAVSSAAVQPFRRWLMLILETGAYGRSNDDGHTVPATSSSQCRFPHITNTRNSSRLTDEAPWPSGTAIMGNETPTEASRYLIAIRRGQRSPASTMLRAVLVRLLSAGPQDRTSMLAERGCPRELLATCFG